MIHIAYALSDKQGTYSKFAGASMASMLSHTKAKLSFHLLHDGSLSEENKERFTELARGGSAGIRFYNVPARLSKLLQRGREILPEGMDSERYTGANLYRLLLPEALPGEVERVIFLDADTIVNLDIAELWQEEIGEAGLAAVPDYEVLKHFGQERRVKPNGSFLYEEGLTDVQGIFNAGVLLLDLKVLRRRSSLFLEGLQFLKDHGGKWDFYDNDILIGFFAKSYTHLPWRFQLRLNWALACGGNKVERAIYHYVDRNYSFDPRIGLHALFLAYLQQSPWGGSGPLSACYGHTVRSCHRLMEARLRKIRRLDNAARGKIRVFMGLQADEARLRADFGLGAAELYYPLQPGGRVDLPGSPDTHFYMVFWTNYGEIKGIMENLGLQEFVHFGDGTLLMPERMDELWPEERQIIWQL